MKCANCGNDDSNTLWDEGDVFYCSRCSQRTDKSTGNVYLTKCPVCGEMTRGGAAYCELCNGWKGE